MKESEAYYLHFKKFELVLSGALSVYDNYPASNPLDFDPFTINMNDPVVSKPKKEPRGKEVEIVEVEIEPNQKKVEKNRLKFDANENYTTRLTEYA